VPIVRLKNPRRKKSDMITILIIMSVALFTMALGLLASIFYFSKHLEMVDNEIVNFRDEYVRSKITESKNRRPVRENGTPIR